jgi:hypothetical protein
MPTEPRNGDSSRIARLESALESLAETVRNMAEQFDRDMSRIANEINRMGRPQWSTYLGFAGIILSIVGMVFGAISWGYGKDQARLESIVTAMAGRELEKSYNWGQVNTHISELKILTTDLDTRLQREMRDVNSTTEAKLAALDKRLQEEISRSLIFDSESRNSISKTVDHMQVFIEQMQRTQASNVERVRALERNVFMESAAE